MIVSVFHPLQNFYSDYNRCSKNRLPLHFVKLDPCCCSGCAVGGEVSTDAVGVNEFVVEEA